MNDEKQFDAGVRQSENIETFEIPTTGDVTTRRGALRFGLRTLLGCVGLSALAANRIHKWNIQEPQALWKRIDTIGDHAAELTGYDRRNVTEILLFEDAVEQSGLSLQEIAGVNEYRARITAIAHSIVEAVKKDRNLPSLEQHARKYWLLTSHAAFPMEARMQLKISMADAVRTSLSTYEYEIPNGPYNPHYFDLYRISKILHYSDLSIDDVFQDAHQFRSDASDYMKSELSKVSKDASRSYMTVEIASLMQQGMGVQLQSMLTPDQWKSLGENELKKHEWFISNGLFVGRVPHPDGYISERLLATNRIAAFAGIDQNNPVYQSAFIKANAAMIRAGQPHCIKRKLERGELY